MNKDEKQKEDKYIEEHWMSKNMILLKKDYPDLYKNMAELKEIIYTDNVHDDRTLKLVSIALTAANEDIRGTRKQIISGIKEFNFTREELIDILKVVLLLAGKPAFMKAIGIVYDETGGE